MPIIHADALPCPFCGGPPSVQGRGTQNWVECWTPLCHAMGPNLATPREAITGWNRRTSVTAGVASCGHPVHPRGFGCTQEGCGNDSRQFEAHHVLAVCSHPSRDEKGACHTCGPTWYGYFVDEDMGYRYSEYRRAWRRLSDWFAEHAFPRPGKE